MHASTCFWPEANERYHGVVTEPQGMRQAKTARQWELVNGGTIVDWMRTSGVAQRMLADICFAVEATVSWTVHNDAEMARRVIAEFPSVLSRCDSLDFDTMEQALAYLILHLPDRYTRAFQVLEQLLVNGVLPLGKRHNFAAIDIGAGPGPAIFAARNLYAALSHYVSHYDPSWQIATLGYSHVVEKSMGDAGAHAPLRRGSCDGRTRSNVQCCGRCLPGGAQSLCARA